MGVDLKERGGEAGVKYDCSLLEGFGYGIEKGVRNFKIQY